jgi:transcriptional regulator with XRE-family HTH domain
MRVHPTRITAALDAAGCTGARVDRYLGGAEPMVDEWEAGRAAPSPIQVWWLCDLTGVPPWWLCQETPARLVARVCPGFTPLYEIPPGADRDRAAILLRRWRSSTAHRG